MTDILEQYILVYSITALPTVIYSSYTTAKEPLTFDAQKLYIPSEIKALPLELRISLFNPDGSLREMTSTILPSAPATIAVSANLTGLKLVKNLIDELNRRS